MIKIKLTTEFPQWPIERQTPNNSKTFGNCEFSINEDAQECDVWVVYDGLLQEETILCDRQNLIFITAEPETVRNYHPDFLNQFSTIITSNRQIKHKNIIYTQQALPWMVGRRVKNEKNISFSKDYDELKSINSYNKTKLISVISSNKAFTDGHRKRLEFVSTLKDHFGDTIDIFGRGICDIEDKWDAIADYKYHIALENYACTDYWTEKLSDCYLGGAYPFYFGCTNLADYFNENSFTYIDINNIKGSIKLIEEAITNNQYEKSVQNILDAKNLVLDKHNLFAMISEHIKTNEIYNIKKEIITLKPETYFANQRKIGIKENMIKSLKPIEKSIRTLRDKILGKKKTDIPIYTIDKNLSQWLEAKGDETLRLNYDLNENSLVFDVGGFEGNWANDIFNKYQCNVYVFEPVSSFIEMIKNRFQNNNKIKVFDFGLSNTTQNAKISLETDRSSVINSSENFEIIKLKNIAEFIEENDIKSIDLMKINIEGSEYELLNSLIDSNMAQRVKNIQVQFHEFVPDARNKMKAIQQKLSETHELTYQYEFIWENWRIKQSVLSK